MKLASEKDKNRSVAVYYIKQADVHSYSRYLSLVTSCCLPDDFVIVAVDVSNMHTRRRVHAENTTRYRDLNNITM